ncbi:MAG: hypothetical protein QXO03_03385 [Thermoplasmatales archaeon]
MKSTVLLVAVIIIIAALSFFIYYQYQNAKEAPQGSHVYIGAIYDGQVKYGSYVSATISFGGGKSLEGKVYYVILSVWDNNKSYDQVGISSLNGSLFSTYSYTYVARNGTIEYRYDPHWFPIGPGTHLVSMQIRSGNVTFTVDGRSFIAFTGGNYFIISRNEVIGNVSYSDFTVYEEIYKFNGVLPYVAYNFTGISYSTQNSTYGVTSWAYFLHNVSEDYASTVFFLGNTVNIYNRKPLSLQLQIQNSESTAEVRISDLNFTVLGNTKYYVYLLPGNYDVTVSYLGNVKNYAVNLTKNYTLTIQL